MSHIWCLPRNFRKSIVTTSKCRWEEQQVTTLHDSPTATSLFWNTFRNHKGRVLLEFARSSDPDIKTACGACLPIFASLLHSESHFHIFLRYFRRGRLKHWLMSHHPHLFLCHQNTACLSLLYSAQRFMVKEKGGEKEEEKENSGLCPKNGKTVVSS